MLLLLLFQLFLTLRNVMEIDYLVVYDLVPFRLSCCMRVELKLFFKFFWVEMSYSLIVLRQL